MTTRLVLLGSAALGLLILVPVLAVVILGAYGSSLRGLTKSTGGSGAELSLIPSHGLPGTVVRIEGRHWPARAVISLYFSRLSAGQSADPLRMRLARIPASRSGTFRIDAIIPAALISRGSDSFLVTSEAFDRSGADRGVVSAEFQIAPYPNSLAVGVVDASSGELLGDSRVEARDAFGQLLATVLSGPDGVARFTGLRPGPLKVGVRRAGFHPESSGINVETDSIRELTISPARAPIRCLYVPAATTVSGGEARFLGIDRWTGLPFQHEIRARPNRRLPSLSENSAVYFGYMVPIEINQPSPTHFEDYPVPPKLWAIGSALSTARRDVHGFPRSISLRCLGRLAQGDIVYSATSSGIDSVIARIMVADPKSSAVITKTRISAAAIPVLLVGRGVVILVDRFRGTVRSLDLTSGEVRRYDRRLPAPVIHVIPTSDAGTSAFVLSARGTLHKMDLDSGTVGPVRSSNPGSTRIALAPDGRVMLLNPFKDEFVVMDATGTQWETSVPLPGRATWLWIDPEGPFIYAGHYVDGSLNVHLIEKDTLKFWETLKFPNSVSGDDEPQTPNL